MINSLLSHDQKIRDITKEYTDMYKVIIYKNPLDIESIKRRLDKARAAGKLVIGSSNDDSKTRSVRRSRTVIADYCGCNTFDWFVTFTFNPRKVNRYDLAHCYHVMQGWLWRSHRKYSNFGYIIVPEHHKDGAIHFHALITGYDGRMSKTKVIQNDRRVYNIPGFTFGFTNAQKLDGDIRKTTAYLCKYITKDMELVSNRRRYWCSKNLRKPEKYYNVLDEIYGLNHAVDPLTQIAESPYNVTYEVPKHLLAEMS